MEELLRDYGYWVLLIGTFLEGETILLIAGYMASMGVLSLPLCIAAAFTGTFLGDQLYYYIGRFYGVGLIRRWSRAWRKRLRRVLLLLKKYDTWFILSFRFIYGVRNVTPFAVGMSGVHPLRYFLLNAIAAAIWAVSFGVVGFLFGKAVEQFLGEYQHWVLVGLVGIALTIWLVLKFRDRREIKREEKKGGDKAGKKEAEKIAHGLEG